MRVLIADRYFVPDTAPYAKIVLAIARRWVRDGHSVSVLAAQPSYHPEARRMRAPRHESVDGIDVRRLALLDEKSRGLLRRAINLCFYTARVTLHLATTRRYDAVMVCTTNPIVLPLAVLAVCRLRGMRLIYHCQDIFPEAAMVSGLLKSRRVGALATRLDSIVCRHADATVVLSRDMSDALAARGRGAARRVRVINNFILDTEAPPPDEPLPFDGPDPSFRILFAGNLGFLQGVEYLVEAARLLADDPAVTFHIVGDGVAKKRLIAQAGEMLGKTVFFYPHQSLAMAKDLIGRADLSVISLRKGVYRVAYPSKTMTTLSAGGRVLACVEGDSELAGTIRDNGLGVVAAPQDANAMAQAIRAARGNADEPPTAARQRAKDTAQRLFGTATVLDAWSALLVEVSQDRPRPTAQEPGA